MWGKDKIKWQCRYAISTVAYYTIEMTSFFYSHFFYFFYRELSISLDSGEMTEISRPTNEIPSILASSNYRDFPIGW